jgi:moderate conductance mechanosensitive channel
VRYFIHLRSKRLQKFIIKAIAFIICSLILTIAIVPTTAQIPSLPNPLTPSSLSNDLDNRIVSGWIYIDGRRLFQIAATRSNFSERLDNIQQNLSQISQNYFNSPRNEVDIQSRTLNGLPVIYIDNQYLMSVTDQDAKFRQVDLLTTANQIVQVLQKGLQRAKQERGTKFLVRQSQIAAATIITTILISWGVARWQRHFKRDSTSIQPLPATSITTQIQHQQQRNLKEAKRRLFQLIQTAIWLSAITTVLGLFPYTRALQVGILAALQIPLILCVVALLTYVVIRFSYALIDRFTSALVSSGAFLVPETPERLQLRVSTISGVTKSIATIAWLIVSILLALMLLGVNVIPLLAGAGLVGVAVSLASQSLIKDAINGFLIILEDQYALGDAINVGNVSGLVENLNLRMTQIRDAEGRLITIPNSEIKIVANLSNRWSRADLNIPVAYQSDIDSCLQLIENVAFEMDEDPQWQELIIEKPRVLGVENFGDRGLMIRVWIKTQPLKQWDVAREYRRRLKIAFDKAGISIPLPQQAIWVNDNHLLK